MKILLTKDTQDYVKQVSDENGLGIGFSVEYFEEVK